MELVEMINYEKRKNTELFTCFEEERFTNLSHIQNYIPIYDRFFDLNETNYNSINLKHKWFITNIKQKDDENNNLYKCNLKNGKTNKTKAKNVFFKMAPLLDPFKYITGKYNILDPNLFNLPKTPNVHAKITDVNNSAYVDGFFSFLTNSLNEKYGFSHGVDYYGSFLAIKNSFMFDVADDVEYLSNCDFFKKHRNNFFSVDDFPILPENNSLAPLKISNENLNIQSSINPINDEMFENLFDSCGTNELSPETSSLCDMSSKILDVVGCEKIRTLKSESSCSSRTSHTSGSSNYDSEEDNEEDSEEDNEDNEEHHDDCSEYSDGAEIFATIPKFPVQVICMEYCENTFDDLIVSNDLSDEEWVSALMQIIMMLLAYQKAYSFTHNDLHTNNVMYVKTEKKYLYYCYNNTHYKVPTFGRIFKIIDFGRAIYKFGGKLFCSDSYQPGGDAATQYNTEPYMNEKKPRLEPNPSFDLCRLACSIFDYVVDDLNEIKHLDKCDDIVRLIVEWCLDDSGINILYKNNGDERYPEFKLYKMIARTVHNHTPQEQLKRPLFKKLAVNKSAIDVKEDIINIDTIDSCVNL